MKKRIQSLSFLATLAVVLGMISWGSVLSAQTTPSTPPDQQTPQTQPTPSPEMPPSAQPTPSSPAPGAAQTPDPNSKSAPDANSKTPSASGAAAGSEGQVFSGTVVKQGDKYVLKDDSGKTYDIDHQDDVKKFEGKRVRVQGTLDANGKIAVK